MKVTFANACCSGGGVYLYIGSLDNGLYFIASDNYISFDILLVDVVPDFENSFYNDFMESHAVDFLKCKANSERSLFRSVLKWILKNNPEGNYCKSDLKARLGKF